MALRVLVVDDEGEMATLLARGLTGEGYEVDAAADGIEAMSRASERAYDLAVLDVMLPGMSGFELCRRMREQLPGVGILLLTARDAVDDRIRGLDAGADDYLTKPFAFEELAARLRALMRREAIGASALQVAGLRLDLINHRIVGADREVPLSRTEFDLLRMLAQSPRAVLTRSDLLASIWGSATYIDPNIVDQYVSYVRRKLDAAGSPARILTVRGVGFTLGLGPRAP